MSITNYDGLLEAMLKNCEDMYENIAKATNAYHDSVETAYKKILPNKFFDFKSINKVGGKTILWNQLCGDASLGTGITYNGNGEYIIDGTFTANKYPILSNVQTITGHKYYIACHVDKNIPILALYNNSKGVGVWNDGVPAYESAVQEATDAEKIYFRIAAGTYDNVTVKAKCIDLTVMFGAGNEPTTVAEVDAMFPSYYEYEEGGLLSAGVTSVISKDNADATLDTITIPDEIKSMEGYGWSSPSAFNYIDFQTKKFVQAVGSRAYEAGDESDSTVITDGTNTHYKLDTPLEFDVELSDEIITKAVAGGSLTFENQLGDDYKIPVPVQMEYIGV